MFFVSLNDHYLKKPLQPFMLCLAAGATCWFVLIDGFNPPMLFSTKGDKQKGNWLFVPASELLNLRLTSHLLQPKCHIFLMEALFAHVINIIYSLTGLGQFFLHIKRIKNR